jgi:phosphoserine aminotransferase
MNVVFRVAGASGKSAATDPDEAAEKEFGKQAAAAGLVGTPGHRSVGGLRVSLYNAVEPAAVEALTSFMRDFQNQRG